MLFRSPAGLELGHDILVKDAPDSREWIYYDAIPADSLKETDMAEKLDWYITEHGLSYTNCGFTRLDGENGESQGIQAPGGLINWQKCGTIYS